MSVGLCKSREPANGEARATVSASQANGERRPVSGPQAREQMTRELRSLEPRANARSEDPPSRATGERSSPELTGAKRP